MAPLSANFTSGRTPKSVSHVVDGRILIWRQEAKMEILFNTRTETLRVLPTPVEADCRPAWLMEDVS